MSWRSAIRNWYINRWFPSQKEALRIGKLPNPSVAHKGWEPPAKEVFLAYCDRKKIAGSWGLRLYRYMVARNWTYYGQEVKSDEQWQAICHTHEFPPDR